MSASIVNTGFRAYQAWCEECQDGVNSGRRICQRWAEKHNAEHHDETHFGCPDCGEREGCECRWEGVL